jgi:hypothetical protein
MISNVTLSTDEPIAIKKNINELLFKDINYNEEILKDDIKIRNVNYYVDEKKTNDFNDIVINDCAKKQESPVYNYNDLILKIIPESSDEPEDIDTLIKNINDDIGEISEKINEGKAIVQSIWYKIKKELPESDKQLIQLSTDNFLQQFIDYENIHNVDFDF